MNIVKPTLLTSIFAILALVPCYFSFKGLWFFLNSDQATNSEGLIVMGIMTIPALILLVLYILSILFVYKDITKKVIAITATPFLAMLVLTIYGTYLGIPW